MAYDRDEARFDAADAERDALADFRAEAAGEVIRYSAPFLSEELTDDAYEGTGGVLDSTFVLAVDGVLEKLAAKNRGSIWLPHEAKLVRAWDEYMARDVDALPRAHKRMKRTSHAFEAGSHGDRCRLCLSKLGQVPHMAQAEQAVAS